MSLADDHVPTTELVMTPVRREWPGAAVWILLAVVLMLTVSSAIYTAGNLEVDTDTAEMFSPDVPFRRNHEAFRRQFPGLEQTLLIVVDGSSRAAIDEVAGELRRRLENDERFSSVVDPLGEEVLRRSGILFSSLDEIEAMTREIENARPMLEALARDPSAEGLTRILRQSLPLAGLAPEKSRQDLARLLRTLERSLESARDGKRDPVRWEGLFGEARPIEPRVLTCRPRLEFDALLPAERSLERVRGWIRELTSGRDDVHVSLTGEVALLHDELVSSETGVKRSAILSLVLVLVLLRMAFRSWRLIVLSIATLLIGLAWTAAFAAITVGHLNLISIAFAVLYISLGIDGSIHFCARFQELRARGVDGALGRTVREIGFSLFLATLTTAFGFLAFVPTPFDAVAELGIIASGGIFISFLVNLTVLPALIRVVGAGAPGTPKASSVEQHLTGPILRHRVLVRSLAGLSGVAAIWLCLQAEFDPDPHHLRDPAAESVRAFDELARHRSSTPVRAHSLSSSREEAERRARRLEESPEVSLTFSAESFVPSEQEEKLAILSGLVPLPSSRETDTDPNALRDALLGFRQSLEAVLSGGELAAAAKRLATALEGWPDAANDSLALLSSNWVGELPRVWQQLEGLRSLGPLSFSDYPPSFQEHWVSKHGVYRLDVLPAKPLDVPADLARFVRAVQAVDPDVTGAPVIQYEAGQLAVESFQLAFLWALAANLLLLVVIFRHPLDVLAVLTPVLLGGVLTGAIAVLAGMPFNFANVIALPLLLGFGIDNGVHMVHRHRTSGAGAESLLGSSTSRAVLFSSLTTIGGFGTLALSPHIGTASLGLLLTVGIGSVLAATMLVLPAMPLSKRREKRS